MLTPDQNRYLEAVKKIVRENMAGSPADVYLFGSWAREEVYPNSDLDLAVAPRGQTRLAILARLRAALEESSVPYRVDLVNLDEAPDSLRDKVRQEGIPWIR